MDSYWHLDYEGIKNKDTIAFISEQASFLEIQTNGLVLAHFCIKRGSSVSNAFLSFSALSSALSSISNPGSGRVAKDASSLYAKRVYEFYVSDKNNCYELAIFDLICNDEYPITLKIDSTIAQEAGVSVEKEINSLDEFKDCFADLLKTNKVNYVIQRLRKMSLSTEQQ